MSPALIFMANWRKWQRELRCRKGFGLFDSVRFGLWLARGSASPTRSRASGRKNQNWARRMRKEATAQ
jgi:hypothetical protein